MKKIICASLLCLLSALSVLAQQKPPRLVSSGQLEINALRGLNSLTVEVVSDIKQKGFEPELIEDSIYSRLKSEHVPVVTDDKPHSGRLVVALNSSGAGDVILIRVRLLRLASTDCETDLFYVPMWERESFSRVDKLFTAQLAVSYLIDSFAYDYNSLNRR